jgi:undecaprenyl-diphosphatase
MIPFLSDIVVMRYCIKNKKTIIFSAFSMLLLLIIIEKLLKNQLYSFDNAVYKRVFTFYSADMTNLMRIITFTGSGGVMILIDLVIIFITLRRLKDGFYAKIITVNFIAVSILNFILKQIFHRARPQVVILTGAGGFSFPSGHAITSLCFYGLIAYILYVNMKTNWRYPVVAFFLLLILSIGISRIYLGVHFASDIVAAFLIGVVWLAFYVKGTGIDTRKKKVNTQ